MNPPALFIATNDFYFASPHRTPPGRVSRQRGGADLDYISTLPRPQKSQRPASGVTFERRTTPQSLTGRSVFWISARSSPLHLQNGLRFVVVWLLPSSMVAVTVQALNPSVIDNMN